MLHSCCNTVAAHARTCFNILSRWSRSSVGSQAQLEGPRRETKEAWIVDYRDQNGTRHIKTFARKRDADAYHANVAVEVRAGTHTADSKSLTITEAGRRWIESGEAAGLERTTLEQYRQHLTLHIAPEIGTVKLAQLTVPMVRALEDRLRADRSAAMVRKILGSLGAILADAQERGLVAQNVVRGLRTRRRRGKDRQRRQAQERQAQGRRRYSDAGRSAGHHRPPRRALAAYAAHGDLHRPAGFRVARAAVEGRRSQARRNTCPPARRPAQQDRASQIRGGRAHDPAAADGGECVARVEAGLPKGRTGLVFPNGRGRVENYSNIVKRGLMPVQIAAKITDKHRQRKIHRPAQPAPFLRSAGASTGAWMADSNCR